MNKIFIDAGANIGQSIEVFCNKWKDYNEYKIHSFEPNSKFNESILSTARKFNLLNFNLHNEAIYTKNTKTTFYLDLSDPAYGSSLNASKQMITSMPIEVNAIDIADWITKNFSKDDYIILKLDIEGTEYEVLNHLFETNTIHFFNEIYFEPHSHKANIDKQLVDKIINLIETIKLPKIYNNVHRGLNFI
jgi:FkbM family methyltransferase